MPQVHNQLLRGGLSAALRNALDAREGGIERFGETLDPVIDLWRLPEWAFLRGERICGAAVTVNAGAATECSAVALRNPANSGMLAVVEYAIVSLTTAAGVQCQMASEAAVDAVLATDTVGVNLDTRFANQTNPVCFLSSGATPAIPIGVRFAFPTRPTYFDTPEVAGVVLSPGFCLVIQNPDDAAAIHVAYRWRERKANKGELG